MAVAKLYFFPSVQILFLVITLCSHTFGFWDMASTTLEIPTTDLTGRQSFFRWQWSTSALIRAFVWIDWWWNDFLRRTVVMAGISVEFKCLSSAVLLNRRSMVSAYNYLDPYMHRQRDLRIWSLGRAGKHITPFRYRVLRVVKLIPKSLNPEHCHGPRCKHSPRHDVALIISLDQIYLFNKFPWRYLYAYRCKVGWKYRTLPNDIWFAGTGYESPIAIKENYKIVNHELAKWNIVDCSEYLPKWWGKFICIRNTIRLSGVPNGGGFFGGLGTLYGIGCFEIRYNNDRIFVFTDMRYYYYSLHSSIFFGPGDYYEYAYPQWGIKVGYVWDGGWYTYNNPFLPSLNMHYDLFPLG